MGSKLIPSAINCTNTKSITSAKRPQATISNFRKRRPNKKTTHYNNLPNVRKSNKDLGRNKLSEKMIPKSPPKNSMLRGTGINRGILI